MLYTGKYPKKHFLYSVSSTDEKPYVETKYFPYECSLSFVGHDGR